MKKTTAILLLAALALVACHKEKTGIYSRAEGDEIIFGAVQQGSDTGLDTKAACSGTTGNVAGTTGTKAAYNGSTESDGYERINWEAGDQLRIHCPQASEPSAKYEDYFVTSSITPSGAKSSAGIDHNAGNIGLRWGTGTHCFYSMYPHPSKGESGIGVDGTEGIATCVLPATQTYGSITQDGTDGDCVASPNSKYLYLAGYATATAGGSGGPVQINYNPAVTTFQITVQNDFDDDSDMTVASAGITTSKSNFNLTGTYQVKLDGDLTTADITQPTPTAQTITMTFSDGTHNYITLAKGKKLTFTIFAQPGQDADEITFWMKDKDGALRQSALKKRDASTWVSFPAFHKANITGLMAPKSSKWYIEIGGSSVVLLDGWTSGGEPNVTQITLKQTELELWCKDDGSGNYTYYDSEAKCTAGTGDKTQDEILINGEFETDEVPTASEITGELAKLVSASVENKSGKTYNLKLQYTAIPGAVDFTDNVIQGNVVVNHVGTNSYATLAVTIHKVTTTS